jgi:L-alanine-DL-glutamate epimerase-like enolase superfamily enzyme
MTTIATLSVHSARLPMPVPWGPGRDHQHIIVASLTTDDGAIGCGFSWTVDAGASAIQAMLEADCRGIVEGGEVSPVAMWDRLRWHLRECGSGIATLAIAAIDIALWDLRAKAAGLSLVDHLGPRRDRVPAYASGVNRHLSLGELTEQVQRWIAAGHSRVKIKIGLPSLEEDLERVAAVRRVIGPGRLLMLDANQLWDFPAARKAARALSQFDVYWLEEPLQAEDTSGYARLRADIGIPIAAGESLFSEAQFHDLLATGGCDYIQPNVCRVGGITPFLRIASVARSFGVPVMPHLLPDISGQLALCLPGQAFVEDIDQGSFAALGALARPAVVVTGDSLHVERRPGHGLEFRIGPDRAGAS